MPARTPHRLLNPFLLTLVVMVATMLVLALGTAPGATAQSLSEQEDAVEKATAGLRTAQEEQNSLQRKLENNLNEERRLDEQLGALEKERSRSQGALDTWAETIHMNGTSPASAAAFLNVADGDSQQVIGQMEVISFLAEENSGVIEEFSNVEKAIEDAKANLAEVRGDVERQLQDAEKLLDERERASEEAKQVLDRLVGEERSKEALASAASSGDGDGGGGGPIPSSGSCACDLSSKPQSAQLLLRKESGWNACAQNPSSTAFGLGQLLIANRRAFLGANYATTDCNLQYNAANQYVEGRYGTWDAAWAHSQRIGWY